jgi:hypothetical protein
MGVEALESAAEGSMGECQSAMMLRHDGCFVTGLGMEGLSFFAESRCQQKGGVIHVGQLGWLYVTLFHSKGAIS